MGNWKTANDLTDREVRQLLAGALAEIVTLRRTLAIAGAMLLVREGIMPQPPEDVRDAMQQGLDVFLENVLDVTDDEDRVIRVQKFEQHRSN